MIEQALISNQPACLHQLPSAESEKALALVEQLADEIKQSLPLITLEPLQSQLPGVLYFSTFFTKTCQRFAKDIALLISSGDLQMDYCDRLPGGKGSPYLC